MSKNTQQEQFRVECLAILRDEDGEKAVLVEVDPDEYGLMPGRECEVWIPRSQLHSYSSNPDDCHAMVTPWIAQQKGLK